MNINHDLTDSDEDEGNDKAIEKLMLYQLDNKRVIQVLKNDPVMKVLLKTDLEKIITNMKITGADLANLNDGKIEKWFGIKESSKITSIMGFIKENKPYIKANLLKQNEEEK